MKKFTQPILLIVLGLLWVSSGFAQTKLSCIEQVTEIAPDDLQEGDAFGASMALSGNTLLIGAPEKGAAYICDWNDSEWKLTKALIPDEDIMGASYGKALALSDKWAAVGAPQQRSNQKDEAGVVYIFHKEGNEWIQATKLTPNDESSRKNFGEKIALSDSTIIIGATGDGFRKNGAVYVFELIPDSHEWKEVQKIRGISDKVRKFGNSISLDASTNRMLIGTNEFGAFGSLDTVYIYQRNENIWNLEARLTGQPSASNFGSSLALFKNTVFVGAPKYGSSEGEGAVFVYERDMLTNNWLVKDTLQASNKFGFKRFGTSLSVSGNQLLIGDNQSETEKLADKGEAYIFCKIDDNWIEQNQLILQGAAINDQFGSQVAIFQDQILVTAPNRDEKGALFVFQGVAIPEEIQGDIIACSNSTYTYSAPLIEGLQYQWLTDEGITTQNENTVTVEWRIISDSAQLTLLTTTPCGTINSLVLPVKVIANDPLEILGANVACAGEQTSYSVETNKDSLSWNIQGGNILSGQGTNQVLVQWDDIDQGQISLNAKDLESQCVNSGILNINIKRSSILFIDGKHIVDIGEVSPYWINSLPEAIVEWEIIPKEAGIIQSGQGQDSILIEWREQGAAQINVKIIDPSSSCTFQDSIKVEIDESILEEACQLFVPELFSPNGDLNNDTFKIYFLNDEVINLEMKVWDRQGHMVYQTSDPQEIVSRGWDGGNQLAGTYIWTLKVEFQRCSSQELNGRVSLVR